MNRYKILIIADNQDVSLIETLLKQEKHMMFELTSCNRLSKGIDRLTSNNFDAVILDFSLPDSRGIEAYNAVISLVPKLPVVVLTSIDDKDMAIKALGTGVQDYLVKGRIDKDILVRTLGYCIELKRAENDKDVLTDHLMQAQKMEAIGQLAAGISHELNTPLQYVGDNTHFLQNAFDDLNKALLKYEDLIHAIQQGQISEDLISEVDAEIEKMDVKYLREEIPKAIQQSLVGIERASKIVLAMKDFCHPGKDEMRAIDINKAIISSMEVSRNEWKYVADIKTDFDPNIPPVPCIEGEFQQVVLNMIINSAHAISDVSGKRRDSKGIINISTKSDLNNVELRISDTGPGIPQEIQSRIFEPFFTTKGVGKGTGQGLAISHSVIVNKHGGTIRLETEEGVGTTFVICLPLGKKVGEKLDES